MIARPRCAHGGHGVAVGEEAADAGEMALDGRRYGNAEAFAFDQLALSGRSLVSTARPAAAPS